MRSKRISIAVYDTADVIELKLKQFNWNRPKIEFK